MAFDQVRDTGVPLWVSLEAPSGAGKTRVAREFYSRLACGTAPSRQSRPPYWPPSILGATKADLSDVDARRKRVYPETFDRPPGSLPSWMWWGIACYQRNGVASLALVNDIAQLNNHALWWTAAWSRHAPMESLGAKVRDLRDVATAWGKGTVEAKAIEVAVQLAVGSLPFLGLFKKVAVWTKDQTVEAWKTHEAASTASTIEAGRPKDELLDDAVAMLRHLAIKGLPVVLFVEDLHLADDLLIKLLVTLLNTDAAIMVVTTGWPGHLDDEKNPEHLLWRGTLPDRMIRIKHDRPVAPGPFPEGAGLGDLTADDLKEVVRCYFPRVEAGTLIALVERYKNPLELELACLQPKYADDFPNGDLELTAREIERLPEGLRALFDRIWMQLPEPVRGALALAAITQPAAIAAGADEVDQRWLPSRLAAAAVSAFPEKLDLHATLRGEGRNYAWARVVDTMLRQFNEPIQREVAGIQAEGLYSERGRLRIYEFLAAEVLAETVDAGAPPGVAQQRAHTILALNMIGAITDPAAVADATLTLVEGLRFFPREYPRVLKLIQWAKQVARESLSSANRAMLTLRLYAAITYGEVGNVTEAIAESRALLVDQVSELGPEHSATLTTRNYLARWLSESGRLDEAIKEFRAVLAARRRVRGADDVATIRTRSNLAWALGKAGSIDEAVAAFRSVLDDRLRLLNPDHPDVLRTRRNLAFWQGMAGQIAEALAASVALREDMIRVLGPDHIDTLRTRRDVAFWQGMAGRIDEAIATSIALREDLIRVLGSDHPDTLTTRNNLASQVGESGQTREAIGQLGDVLTDRLRVLGPDHPDTLQTRHDLARWLREAGRVDEATAEFRSLLRDQVRVLGPNHPDTVSTRTMLSR
jgi:tetratricopeptide (TPR) repeat protein